MDSLEEKHLDTSRGFHYRYYTSSGDTSKPAILLCHGFPDDARLWQFVIPHLLKSKLRLVVPDLLGAGATSKPTDPAAFEIKAMVSDALEILQKEGIDSNIIPMGHDWGSYLAQRFYLLNPDRCAGLVTLNVALMAPRGDPFDLDAFNKFTEQAVGYPLYAYWELFLPPEGVKLMNEKMQSVWYVCHGDQEDWMKKMFCVRGAMKEFLEADRQDVPLKPYAQPEKGLMKEWLLSKEADGFMSQTCWYRALAGNHNQETESQLHAKVEKPYLFIGCDGDAVCRTDFIWQSKQQGLLEDLTVEELHSGHWCPYEKPDEVGRITLDWLKAKGFSD